MKNLATISDSKDLVTKEYVDNAAPASASVDSSGLITFKNSTNTSVFTLQLPVYSGAVINSANGVSF